LLQKDFDEDKASEVRKFNWGAIYKLNFIIKDMLAKYFPQVIYLDVERSTALRRDGHMSGEDCLHYCIPGPIDNWVIFA
jgi:hypothetical protein